MTTKVDGQNVSFRMAVPQGPQYWPGSHGAPGLSAEDMYRNASMLQHNMQQHFMQMYAPMAMHQQYMQQAQMPSPYGMMPPAMPMPPRHPGPDGMGAAPVIAVPAATAAAALADQAKRIPPLKVKSPPSGARPAKPPSDPAPFKPVRPAAQHSPCALLLRCGFLASPGCKPRSAA
jgi:hypothetical protein